MGLSICIICQRLSFLLGYVFNTDGPHWAAVPSNIDLGTVSTVPRGADSRRGGRGRAGPPVDRDEVAVGLTR